MMFILMAQRAFLYWFLYCVSGVRTRTAILAALVRDNRMSVAIVRSRTLVSLC